MLKFLFVVLLLILAEKDESFLTGFQAPRSSYEVQLSSWGSTCFHPCTQGSAAISNHERESWQILQEEGSQARSVFVLTSMVTWYQMRTVSRGWEAQFEQKMSCSCSCQDCSRANALMFEQDLSCIRSEVVVGAGCAFLLSGSGERSCSAEGNSKAEGTSPRRAKSHSTWAKKAEQIW